MTSGPRSALLRQFQILFESGTVAGLTDGQLLERFLDGRGEAGEVAFAALVARHGPMVLGVCRRALADPNDAADAFQATFLILVKKAGSVRVDDSLGRWLYGVSRRVAGRARALAARRPRAEPSALEAIPAAPVDPDRFELEAMLDEELARLPESFRSAIVLCDLEGMTHEEAARDLLCPVGTIKSRLARGRKRLRERLERRGLSPSILMLAPTVPPSMADAAVRTSMIVMKSGSVAAGLVPAAVATLTQEVLKAMTGFKLKMAAGLVLSFGLAASGVGVLAQGKDGDPSGPTAQAPGADGRTKPQTPERVRTIEDKLNEPVTLDLKDQPLTEAVQFLKQYTGLSIVLSLKFPTPGGVTEQSRVSLTARAISLRNALNYLLRPIRLTYTVEDDSILVIAPPRDDTTPRDDGLAALHRQLEDARRKLAQAQRISRDATDPAIVMVRKKVSALEAELVARIDEALATIHDDASQPPKNGPPNPGGAASARANLPREFQKITMPDYVVEPPDMIVVEVLEALPGRPIAGERLVMPDGKINLGYYGEVYVAGLTTTEIKEKVAQHLREYLDDEKLGLSRADPKTGKVQRVEPARTDRVFVKVERYNSKVYYVQGDVGVPGRLPVTGNETVLDAINYAGGLTPNASRKRIRLVRPAPPGSTGGAVLPVDLPAIVDRGDVTTNYQIMPGDRLIVDRDPEVAREEARATRPEADMEARLQSVEKKLDEILKALERLPKP